MNLTQEKALLHLAGKPDHVELSVESWQHLAAEYPYFAPAQFFLASKLKMEENSLAIAQQLKTNLYFTNAHWLQFQLQHGLRNRIEPDEAVEGMPETVTPPGSALARSSGTGGDDTEDIEGNGEGPETILPNAGAENKIASLLSNQLADFKKPIEASAKLDIDAEKERLHTIDYFASQGIKIDLSTIPQDKLTTHLRKFTDWLKQMKNANGGVSDLGTNAEMEKAVMETAQNSNETGEVLTEAMADVLVKQGQVDKAIQLYIKLSFLNPEKSSYFAAKIEQLKGI
jgi:hypothetical protein